jgi:hypothetical protein
MGIQINEDTFGELANLVEMLKTKLKTQELKNEELVQTINQQKADMEQLPLLQQTISMQEASIEKMTAQNQHLQESN